MRSLAFGCLWVVSAVCLACGEPQLENGGGKRTAGAINVDPDGIYRFGVNGETWINAANGESPYGNADLWTNSRNETLVVYPAATWTGGETPASLTRAEFDDVDDTYAIIPVILPEAVPYLPGWWWFAWSYEDDLTVKYEGMFVDAPRGFEAEVSLDGGDIGRQRAAAILQSLRFE